VEVNVKNLITVFIILFVINLSDLSAFSLKNGFKLALENDMDSKVNENNLKNIQYDQDIANSLMQPKVDLSVTAQSSKRTEGQKRPETGSHTKSDEYSIQVTQPLFDGFESKYEKELQKKRYESAVYYLKQSQNDVATNYVQSYINVLREKDLLTLSKEKVSISEDIFRKVYKKLDLGYGTKLEYEEVKGNLGESRVNVDTQRINLTEALESLKYYVQRDLDSSELIVPTFFSKMPESLDKAVKIALEENPTVNVAKINLEVAKAQEKQTIKEFYPNVDLVGSYNLNDSFYPKDDNEYNEYTIGVELSYNLYNGGKNLAEAKKALQNIKEKQYLIKKSQYQIKNRVRLAWNSYELNKDKNGSLKYYLIAKKDILDATFKEFDLGLQDLNTLVENYIDYIDVKKDYISNVYDLLYAKYDLLATMGKLADNLLADDYPPIDKAERNNKNSNLFKIDPYNYENNFDLKDEKQDDILQPEKSEDKNDTDNKIIKSNTLEEMKSLSSSLDKKTKKEKSTFKEKFLTAAEDKYTINLAYTDSSKKAEKFLDKHEMKNSAFYFSFGYDEILQKIMYGVFDSKKEAIEALNLLPSSLKRNSPRVEKISIKQKLYKKYHPKSFNLILLGSI
jgi:adhesin transport system outer membrane protein